MTKFFSSDAHFGHRNIIQLSQRPFADVDEMNQAIISNFNERVGVDDTLYLLGDVVLGTFAENIELVGQLNGYKILVPGNHDRVSKAYHHKGDREAKVQRFYEEYRRVFDVVLPDKRDLTVDIGDETFAISHYPYEGDHFTDDRFPELRPEDTGLPLLHGHVHKLWKFNGRQFNVGVDVNDFAPVSEHEVLAWSSTIPK